MNVINFYGEPIVTRRKCDKCNNILGSQNPGVRCETCKWLCRGEKRR